MKKYYQILLTGLIFITVLSSAVMNVNGPGGGYSNAPSESNCTSCHGGSIITSGNSNLNNLRLGGNFTGNGYIPDSTYTIEITYKQTGRSKFGLQVTALDKSNLLAGTFTNTGNRTSKTTASIGGNTREYIQHTALGTANVGTDSTRWTFSWKAPSSNIGNITFYVVVMASNANNTNDAGDIVYGKTFTIAPSGLLPVANAGADFVTCTGYDVQLQGSGTNSPSSWSWKFTGITSPSSSTAQNPVLNYSSAGAKLAILTVKNSKGVSLPDTVNITVNASPNASITTVSPVSICQGDSLQISANSGTNITYSWLHNGKTTQRVYVKDTGFYRVKVTSTVNQCVRTSTPFRLNWYPQPVVALSKNNPADSFCAVAAVTYTATGSNIDSLHWYVNGILLRRSKNLSESFLHAANATVYVVAKNANGCKSAASNSISTFTVPKQFPSAFSFSKTTSEIHLKWKTNPNITAYAYAVGNSAFAPPTTDSTLDLSNLQPNTRYDITIRSFQKSPCLWTDTILRISTNACSNLQYTLDFADRICRGGSLTAVVGKLYAARYSISFNGGTYAKDTVYTFTPTASDSLRISIIDSLSPTCPPISERLAYTVDTFPDNKPADNIQVSLCTNSYTLQAATGYSRYDFYKNNVLQSSGAGTAYTYNGLSSGDTLTVTGSINTCSRLLTWVDFTLKTAADAGFSYQRNWKTYTFTANDASASGYLWKINGDSVHNAASFTSDFSQYSNDTVEVSLQLVNAAGCSDTLLQTIEVPVLSSVSDISGQSFRVYPNPFSSVLQVTALKAGYRLEVCDELGRVVYSCHNPDIRHSIPVSDWDNGLYLLILRTDNGQTRTFRVLKAE